MQFRTTAISRGTLERVLIDDEPSGAICDRTLTWMGRAARPPILSLRATRRSARAGSADPTPNPCLRFFG